MKMLKLTLSMAILTFAIPQLSFAISGSSISDAITNNVNISSTANQSGTLIQDSVITAYIHAQLIITKGVPASIDVETTNGIVKLDGTVASKEQADAVTKIAYSVKGVKSVDRSNLKIKEIA